MLSLRSLLLVLILLSIAGCASKSASDEFLHQPMPHTNFYTLDGEQVSSTQLLGKPTVVAFWAQWCSASRGRMPDMAEFVEASNLSKRVNFVAVGLDEEKDYQKYLKFIEDYNLEKVRHFFSGNGGADLAMHTWKVERLPHFFLLNSNGILAMHSHSFGDVEDLLEEELGDK